MGAKQPFIHRLIDSTLVRSRRPTHLVTAKGGEQPIGLFALVVPVLKPVNVGGGFG